MAKKHFTLFNPDANYDFVGRRHLYYGLTGIGILVSVIALATMGLNKGIDFKGGTKQIVAFKPDAKMDRAGLRATVEKLVAVATGKASDVEVQEFDTGSGGSKDKRHFAVITETATVAKAKKDAIGKAVTAAMAGATVSWAEEGEDRLFLNLPEAKTFKETKDALEKLFGEQGFPKVQVSSDEATRADVELYRALQALRSEGKDDKAVAAEKAKLEAEKNAKLDSKLDTRFTVTIEEFRAKLETGLRDAYGPQFIAIESATAVSPSVASAMMKRAYVAILFALIGIVIYIILRFDVRYAPGALVATAHDVVLVVGAFSVAQVKFSMPIIAAVLTVAGYSVTDTIVVFDRIREMQQKFPRTRIDLLINAAINATMSRTVLTSLTTFMTSAAIFFFGGGLIRDFAFAMCIGVVVGTFSSVFVAAPIFLYLHERFEARKATPATGDAPAAAS
jgi:preprotein translocase SecF subunit